MLRFGFAWMSARSVAERIRDIVVGAAAREHAEVTGRRVTYEATMIDGINDTDIDADAMAHATALVTEHYGPDFIDINFAFSRTPGQPKRYVQDVLREQAHTVGELLEKTEDDLLAITNFGQKSLDEVLVKLDERGLSLRGRN